MRPDPSLELSFEQFQNMITKVLSYLKDTDAQQVNGNIHPFADRGDYQYDLPDIAKSKNLNNFDDILEEFFNTRLPQSLSTTHSGYMAYIPGGGLYHAAIADLIANFVNRYVGLPWVAPLLAKLETDCLKWLAKIIDFNDESVRGVFTPGGSLANLQAIICARENLLDQEDFPKARIYCSSQIHHSLTKAVRASGLLGNQLVSIPTNRLQEIDIEILKQTIEGDLQNGLKPFLLMGNAGTTNTGAVDDLRSLRKIADEHGSWLHVDGAYGAPFNLVDECKESLGGLGLADSVTLDPHKGLFLPYGTGALLVRDGEKLKAAFTEGASYLPTVAEETDIWNFHEYSLELSRDFRGLRLWIPLQLHGEETFKNYLKEKHELSKEAFDQLSQIPQLEMGDAPKLSLFIFKVKNDPVGRSTRDLMAKINRPGCVFLSGTTIDDTFYIRVCILSFRTHSQDVQNMISIVQKAVEDSSID